MNLTELAVLYRELANTEPVFGGNGKLIQKEIEKLKANSQSDPEDFDTSTTIALLLVFEHLSPRDLCRASRVNRQWHAVACNDRLWRNAFLRDVRDWPRVFSHRNPGTMGDVSFKEIYVRCHPNAERLAKDRQFKLFKWPVINVVPPRVVMFGPGLETDGCSTIVRNMISDGNIHNDTRFIVESLTPGLVNGLGAGISVKFNHFVFDLQVLYTNVKAKRHRLSPHGRLTENRLYADGDQSSLSPPIKQLCSHAAAFVYLIDRSYGDSEMNLAEKELSTFLRNVPKTQPLLVLSCYSLDHCKKAALQSAIDVTSALRLSGQRRQWMVQTGEVTTLAGVREGFDWLLKSIDR